MKHTGLPGRISQEADLCPVFFLPSFRIGETLWQRLHSSHSKIEDKRCFRGSHCPEVRQQLMLWSKDLCFSGSSQPHPNTGLGSARRKILSGASTPGLGSNLKLTVSPSRKPIKLLSLWDMGLESDPRPHSWERWFLTHTGSDTQCKTSNVVHISCT